MSPEDRHSLVNITFLAVLVVALCFLLAGCVTPSQRREANYWASISQYQGQLDRSKGGTK